MNGISLLLLRSSASSQILAATARPNLIVQVSQYASKSLPVNASQPASLFKLNSAQLVDTKLRRLFNLNKCHNRFVETTSQTRNYLIKFLNWNQVNAARRLELGRKMATTLQRMAVSSLRQRGVWNGNVFRQNFSTKPNAPLTPPKQPPAPAAEQPLANESAKAQTFSIFQRFKQAYKQHGKILIYCHILTCCGWFAGFFVLAENGFELSKFLGLFEAVHIISHETSESIVNKIKTFDLKKFLVNYHFDYVLPDRAINWLGETVTGHALNSALTAIMLYKIVTPFRYMLTLGVAKVVINTFKRRGLMPARPPPGSTIKDLYQEQKQVLRRGLKRQREQYSTTRVGRLFNKHNRSKPPRT